MIVTLTALLFVIAEGERTCKKVYTSKWPSCDNIMCISGWNLPSAEYWCGRVVNCDGFALNANGHVCFKQYCKGGLQEASKGYMTGGYNYHRCQNHDYKNTNGGTCTVRIHKGRDCPNTITYERSPIGDVLKSWSSREELYVHFTSADGGWYAINNDRIVQDSKAASWENDAVSFSFSGDCDNVEFFDEDAYTVNCDNTSTPCLPDMATSRKKNVHGYGHNCRVYGPASGSPEIVTPAECFYACNTAKGCPTPNCVNFRSDLKNDILGFYMRPSMMSRDVFSVETFANRNVVVAAGAIFLALGVVVMYARGKTNVAEEDFISI